MRIILVSDLTKPYSKGPVDGELHPDYKKIRQKIPSGIDYLVCGGYNTGSATIANLLALDFALNVSVDSRLGDIEKLNEKLNSLQHLKKQRFQKKIAHQETLSLCMYHLQEYIHRVKKLKPRNVLMVMNEFGCQLLLTYALGISTDAIPSFNVNAGSVIMLDIHDMSSMNKIHF